MTTRWSPDTCACIIDYDGDFIDPVFFRQCRTHDNPGQTRVHNNSFNSRDGLNPTKIQQEQQIIDKFVEQAKPEFQSR